MFCDLQEEFPKPVTAVLLMVIVYYSERIHITISKGQKCMGQIPGETRQRFQLSSSLESHGLILLLSNIVS